MTIQHYGQIERGAQRGSDQAVARIAQVVGVSPERLEAESRDGAADRLRELLAGDLHEPAPGERLDAVIILASILRKLTPYEQRWLVANRDILDRLETRPEEQDAAQSQRDETGRRTG